MYARYNNDPSTLSWIAPAMIGWSLDVKLLHLNQNDRPFIQDYKISYIFAGQIFLNLYDNPLCHTLLKAWAISRNNLFFWLKACRNDTVNLFWYVIFFSKAELMVEDYISTRIVRNDRIFDASSFSGFSADLSGAYLHQIFSQFCNRNYNKTSPHVRELTNTCHRVRSQSDPW